MATLISEFDDPPGAAQRPEEPPAVDLAAAAATGDVEALAVASYDLGEIAHRHAGAKSALVKLGAKDAALKLIDHEDEDVQRRALQCVSKILLRGGSVAVGGA